MQPMPSFKMVADCLADRTKSYLAGQVDVDVTEVHAVTEGVNHLELREATAIIGLGGSTGMLIAFSFSQPMIDILYKRLTASIDVPPDQQSEYRNAAVTEVANVIVGNCTEDFARLDGRISLSPPVLLEDSKSIYRMKDAMFGTVLMVTPHGSFDIHIVGPQAMFDAQLNYERER
jgi:CheY-specific phosphatase CheX